MLMEGRCEGKTWRVDLEGRGEQGDKEKLEPGSPLSCGAFLYTGITTDIVVRWESVSHWTCLSFLYFNRAPPKLLIIVFTLFSVC